MDCLKNPIIIGLFASCLSFVYLNAEEQNDKYRNHKRGNKNNIKTPIILGVIAFIFMTVWNNYNTISPQVKVATSIPKPTGFKLPMNIDTETPMMNLPKIFIETTK